MVHVPVRTTNFDECSDKTNEKPTSTISSEACPQSVKGKEQDNRRRGQKTHTIHNYTNTQLRKYKKICNQLIAKSKTKTTGGEKTITEVQKCPGVCTKFY